MIPTLTLCKPELDKITHLFYISSFFEWQTPVDGTFVITDYHSFLSDFRKSWESLKSLLTKSLNVKLFKNGTDIWDGFLFGRIW